MKKNNHGTHQAKGSGRSDQHPAAQPSMDLTTRRKKAAAQNLDEVISDEVISDEVISDEVISDEVISDEVIYQVVSYAAEKFLRAQVWEESISPFLERLGEVTHAGRVVLYKNCAGQNGRLLITRQHEWVSSELFHRDVPANPVILPPVGFLGELNQGMTCMGGIGALTKDARQLFATGPGGSYLLLPVFVRNSWWGFLGIEDPQAGREWPEADRAALEAGASILGSAIERDQVGKVLNSTVRISEVAHFAPNLDQLYAMIHQIISELMPSDNFYIALYDEAADLLSFPYFKDEYDDQFPPQKPENGLTEYVIRTGEPLLASPEIFDELCRSGKVKLFGAPSIDWLGVPLITQDRTIGMLAVQSYTPGIRFSEVEKDILVFVSTQIAMAIERKISEAALKDSEERYHSLVDNIPIGVFRCDPGMDGQVLMANPAFSTMLGLTQDECDKLQVKDLFLDPSEGGVFVEALLSKGSLSAVEVQLKRADQKPLWGTVTAKVEYKHANGSSTYFDCAIADITERKQREQEHEAIITLSAALRKATLLADMPPIIIENISVLLKAEAAALVLKEPGSGDLIVVLSRGAWANLTGTRLVERASISAQVMSKGELFHSNVADLDDVHTPLRPFENLDSVICVPLTAQGHIPGVLWVGRNRDIQEDETRILVAIADMAANAIHRAALHEQTERRLQRLAALRTVDSAISASLDLRLALNVLLSQLTSHLNVDASSVLLYNGDSQILEYAAGRGFRSTIINNSRVKIGDGPAGKAALERSRVYVSNLYDNESGYLRERGLTAEGFVAYYAVPLVAKGQLKGVLELFHRSTLVQDLDWIDFLDTMAGQAAIAIDNATLFTALQRSNMELALAYDSTLESWVHALELREQVAQDHSQVLIECTVRMARLARKTESEIVAIRRGVLLHDIGKLLLPDSVLKKNGPLSEEEWEVMRLHPVYAHQLLSPIPYLKNALNIPYCHHERYDGSGYPRHLVGEQIPEEARLFAVVDVWDALRSDRPYRKGWDDDKALEYIRLNSGRHFDPKAVEMFLELLDMESLKYPK